ncbi:MAG: hypothetical protein JNM72_28135 [Deltaproteobacteria bacterium]|nr:hypothetical protein [Deltaproteobacteria bacterium]
MPTPRCPTDRYLRWPELLAWTEDLAALCPERVERRVVGHSPLGRPLVLLLIGTPGDRAARPTFWLDGGTHAAEWLGVLSVVDVVNHWMEALDRGDAELSAWFAAHTAAVMPCVSPDGLDAMVEGAPYLRSTLRRGPAGALREGWTPQDMDGDGVVRLLRWRHPAGPYVQDEEEPLFMRARRLDDDPADAFFVVEEGALLDPGGRLAAEGGPALLRQAPREFGLDLNRNFPGNWAPGAMFGMDHGSYPGSAPEAAAMLAALESLPGVSAAVTNHTFSGVLLTAPYRPDSQLGPADLRSVQAVAADAVRDTGWEAVPVSPDFHYDASRPISGVWADSLATTFGVLAYTLELWDPFAAAGVRPAHRGRFFTHPDEAVLRGLVRAFAQEPTTKPWTPQQHPQLGAVEIGGLDIQHTVRNPPVAQIPAELAKARRIIDRVRRCLPRLVVRARRQPLEGALSAVVVEVENHGYLDDTGLRRAFEIGRVPGLRLELSGEGVVDPLPIRSLPPLSGWGSAQQVGLPLAPALPFAANNAVQRFLVRGDGPWTLRWFSQRAGRGALVIGG